MLQIVVPRHLTCPLLPTVLSSLRHPFSTDPTAEHITDENSIVGGYTPVTKQLWTERLKWSLQSLSEASLPQTTAPKPPKRISVTYPFSSDKTLKEMYRNPWGFVRVGRLLEDLDSLAGNVAFDHCYGGQARGTRPPLLVTASVDAITLDAPLPVGRDLSMGGQVVWTGRSSLDIRMEVQEADPSPSASPPPPSLVALFSFVALDPITKRSLPVNPLTPTSPTEQHHFDERQAVAEERKAARQRAAADKDSILPGAHLPHIRPVVEQLVAEGRKVADMPGLVGGDVVLSRDTALENTFVCQPQQRNMHGRVFGGFLMRRAFELAFASTYMYAGSRPSFLEVDEVTFKSPVDVGDLMRMRAAVLHSAPDPQDGQRHLIRVEVVAHVTRPESVSSKETNTFSFVFAVKPPPGRSLKRVLPCNHLEALQMAPYHLEAAAPPS